MSSIKEAKLHAYKYDEILIISRPWPAYVQREVRKANTYYTENGMIVNPCKHHAMVLGSIDHQFPFTT